MFRTLKVVALAVTATLVLPALAEAYGTVKDFSFTVQQSHLGNPVTFVFAPHRGRYKFEALQGGPINIRLQGKGYRRSWIEEYKIWMGPTNNDMRIASNGFQKGHWETFDKKVSLNPTRDLLKDYEAKALRYCKKHGKPDEKVVGELKIPFTGQLIADGPHYGFVRDFPDAFRVVDYKARIVCKPEPFEVKEVDVSVKYKGGLACPKKATLNVEFRTNKPGKHKIEFMLALDDGTTQWNTAYTYGSGKNSIAKWHRNYTFNNSVSRKYMIIVKGSPISSDWVPMKVTCGRAPGGLTTGPKPSID